MPKGQGGGGKSAEEPIKEEKPIKEDKSKS